MYFSFFLLLWNFKIGTQKRSCKAMRTNDWRNRKDSYSQGEGKAHCLSMVSVTSHTHTSLVRIQHYFTFKALLRYYLSQIHTSLTTNKLNTINVIHFIVGLDLGVLNMKVKGTDLPMECLQSHPNLIPNKIKLVKDMAKAQLVVSKFSEIFIRRINSS